MPRYAVVWNSNMQRVHLDIHVKRRVTTASASFSHRDDGDGAGAMAVWYLELLHQSTMPYRTQNVVTYSYLTS